MADAASLNSHRLSLMAAVVVLATCLTAVAGIWKARGGAESVRDPSPAAPPLAVPAHAPIPSVGVQVIRITIRPTGFDPAELVLPHGRFVLAVDNRSGLNEFTFRLDREGGGRLHEVRMRREQLAWRKVIDPPPGSYVVTEADHPDWVCRVSFTD